MHYMMMIEHWLDSFLPATRAGKRADLARPVRRCYRRSCWVSRRCTATSRTRMNVGYSPNANLEAGHFEVSRFRRAAPSSAGWRAARTSSESPGWWPVAVAAAAAVGSCAAGTPGASGSPGYAGDAVPTDPQNGTAATVPSSNRDERVNQVGRVAIIVRIESLAPNHAARGPLHSLHVLLPPPFAHVLRKKRERPIGCCCYAPHWESHLVSRSRRRMMYRLSRHRFT